MKFMPATAAAALAVLVITGCDGSGLLVPVNPGTATDADGNVYDVIDVGNQSWLATDLRTTRYRNGDPIPRPDNDDWQATTSGAFAVHPHTFISGLDSEQDVLAAYGALYNWYAVADGRGLCPTGWRVPSDADWKQLEMHLGMSQASADSTNRRGTDQGGRLKSERTDPDAHPRWRLPNTGATNASGWSGVPGGYRLPAGNLAGVESTGYWWTSTANGTNEAWNRNLYYDFAFAYRFSYSKSFGFSVRCIMA